MPKAMSQEPGQEELADVVREAVLEAIAPLLEFKGPALTTEEAAAYLGISERSLETLVSAGEIRPTRPTPRTRRFLRETLDTFLRSRIAKGPTTRKP